MKPAETASTDQTDNSRNHQRYRYQKVLDSRKQPIRGLWKRNGNFVARITVEALQVSKNGQQFCDYVRLMAFCGSRRDETLRLKWNDVDWQNRQLTIGSDGLAKNHKARAV